MRGLHRPHFRNRDLKIGQHFKQKRLERFVGAVDLVDQQHRRTRGIGFERLQERAPDQKALGEHIVFEASAVVFAFGLRDADRDHLRGVVPLVDSRRDVEALVALQPDEAPPERRRQHLGYLGFADPGLAFEENRPAHLERQVEHGAERAVGEIIGLCKQLDGGVDRGRKGFCGHEGTLSYRAGVLHLGSEGRHSQNKP